MPVVKVTMTMLAEAVLVAVVDVLASSATKKVTWPETALTLELAAVAVADVLVSSATRRVIWLETVLTLALAAAVAVDELVLSATRRVTWLETAQTLVQAAEAVAVVEPATSAMKRGISRGIVRTRTLGHLVGPWSATSASRRATWPETAPTETQEVMTSSITTSGLAEMTMTTVATLAPTTMTMLEAAAGATTMELLQVEMPTGDREPATAKHLDGERRI